MVVRATKAKLAAEQTAAHALNLACTLKGAWEGAEMLERVRKRTATGRSNDKSSIVTSHSLYYPLSAQTKPILQPLQVSTKRVGKCDLFFLVYCRQFL